MSEQRIVVVGAGLAGAHVVQGLRAEGFTGPVTMLGQEPELPYDRTKLSKEYLQGRMDRAAIRLHDEAWYVEHDVDLRLGVVAASIDRAARVLRLADGDAVAYDRLVLATGADSRRIRFPGADLPGVMTLRELRESDALKDLFAAGGHLAVVGAGWIGLEVAASARQAGMRVTVVAPNAQPLDNILGPRIGAYFADLHVRNGIDLRMGVGAQGVLERDGVAGGVITDHGDIAADAVLIAVGAVPRVSLAEHAGLAVDNGVLTDERMVTSDPAILAVGDIANAHNTLLGQRLRREHWDNALRQGALAARTILGLEGTYDWQPYFYTDQFDLGMEYVGNNLADDEPVVRGALESGEFIVFWQRDGIVTAAMNVNIWDVSDTLRGIVGQQVDRERLVDRNVALADLT
ncbi:NAD(P)/FAD-dependent oxidoreductase [Raineyella sp. LH-20]|uniref:NAD(P)/FAD-dependent oxidoreductase n=1 Tax=Raineyella sp. LH-20 TaxID=3081204 RepID=UPI0029542DA8|nr:FAD-dependent oxidoreductase [Raineyella sp. LH-20]WOP18235.1 FAD-dependent oxidoreductase [Raineyella sp. LH-20]